MVTEVAKRTSAGNLFHSLGAADRNALEPIVIINIQVRQCSAHSQGIESEALKVTRCLGDGGEMSLHVFFKRLNG